MTFGSSCSAKELQLKSDSELVSLCRQGDEAAVDFLLEKYKPLVLRLSRARFLAGGEREDLLQEGMIGLYKAIRDYEKEKGASFGGFAALCIDRQMLHAIEASQREKNRILNNSVELTDEEWEHVDTQEKESPEARVIDEIVKNERMTALNEILSPMERKVLDFYLAGLDYREIAERLGKEAKAIDNALQRIRKKSESI